MRWNHFPQSGIGSVRENGTRYGREAGRRKWYVGWIALLAVLTASCAAQESPGGSAATPGAEGAATEGKRSDPHPDSAGGTAESRQPWTTGKLKGSPEPPPEMQAVRAWPLLTLRRPVAVEQEPGTRRMMVLQNYAWDVYRTTLRRFEDDTEVREAETLLELPELAYSLCFHPAFATNGYFYLGQNGQEPGERHHSRIVRYTLSREAPWQIVPGSALTVIEWDSNGHNGAAAAFGNDGMMYVASGDGTAQNDADESGQDLKSLRSKILRIDVDGAPPGTPYRVPPDNPFVGDPAIRPETWAYGLRNPWRLTADPVSGQIWAGQNGQDLREYANLVERGANYGWSEYEGSRLFLPGRLRGPSAFTPPTVEHGHEAFRSLTGGFVYRGARFLELTGAYIYGDYGTGRVWAARHDGKQLLWKRELADTPLAIAGFGTNSAGDILMADHLGDAVFRLEPTPPAAADAAPFPQKLSETGIFRDTATLATAPGVEEYSLNAPAWHDGASERWWLALPGKSAAELLPAGDPANVWKSWNFPNGTVLVQNLERESGDGAPRRRVETRVLLKEENDWAGYSYHWNEAQTDALLVPAEGRVVPLEEGREWLIPSRSDCVTCHARGANYALGLTAAQLNRKGPDGTGENQLLKWSNWGMLESRDADGKPTSRPPWKVEDLPPLVNPYLEGASLDVRVKSWMAVNCAHCHIPEGGGNTKMNLAPWAWGGDQQLIGAPPQHGDLGLQDARLVTPGDSSRSILPVRVMSRGSFQMPPVGSREADSAGIQLLILWLQQLPGVPEKKP